MVGSRRVKAQSKMGPGEVGIAMLGSLGLLGKLGFACWHLPQPVLAPHTHLQAPPISLFCLPLNSCPLSCLPVHLCLSVLSVLSPAVFNLT